MQLRHAVDGRFDDSHSLPECSTSPGIRRILVPITIHGYGLRGRVALTGSMNRKRPKPVRNVETRCRSALVRSTCYAVQRALQREAMTCTQSITSGKHDPKRHTNHAKKSAPLRRNRLAKLACGWPIINVSTWTPDDHRQLRVVTSFSEKINDRRFIPIHQLQKPHSSQMSRVQALKRYPDVSSSGLPKPRHRLRVSATQFLRLTPMEVVTESSVCTCLRTD